MALPLPEAEIAQQFFAWVSNPLAVMNWDGSLRQGNPAFYALLGDAPIGDFQPVSSPINAPINSLSSWFDLIHPDDRATAAAQWQTLIESGSPGQIESRINRQTGIDCWFSWQITLVVEQQLVYAIGQEVSSHDQQAAELQRQEHLLRTLQEREQRAIERTAQLQQANDALVERATLYRALAQHIPNGAVLLFDRDLRYVLVEGDELNQVGLDRVSMIGKTLWEVFPPAVCAAIEPYYRAALAGRSRVHEIPVQQQIYEAHTAPVRNEQGEIFAGMVLIQNITDRSRNETLLATQNYILELITTGASLSEVLESLAQLIETQSNEAICSILLLDDAESTLHLAASPSLPQSCYEDLAAGIPVNPIDTICGCAAHTRQTVIVSDVAAESRWEVSGGLLRKYGLQACWSTPILSSRGKVLGTFALYYRTPRHPDAAEQRLITIASHLAGVAIERQRSEAALKQREDQLRRITETIPQQVWTATPTGQIDYYSQRWCEFTGKTLEQLQNDGWTEIIHPDDRLRVGQVWAAAVQSGSEYQAEARLLNANGEYRWVLGQARPLRNQQGQIVKWYGTNTDITDRKQAEAALQESEQRLQEILNQSEAVIYLKDYQGRYLLVNRQYELLYARTQTPLQDHIQDHSDPGQTDSGQTDLGQTDRAERIPQTADLFWSYDLEVLETGKPLQFEERLYLPDGVHTYLSTKFPLISADGVPYAVCSIATDITDRKQIELERERYAEQSFRLLQQEQIARAQAEQANRIKDEFLAVLSHELRTPLNPILGWSRLLQNRQLSPEKVQQGLETIERNVKLQTQLIDDLLDISRILRGKLVLDMKSVDLAEPIAAALETVRLSAEAKSIRLSTQYDALMQQVYGDAGRLQQILWNLLSNAIKFTPQGGQVTVRVSAASEMAASETAASKTAASETAASKTASAAATALTEEPPCCAIPFVRIQVTDTGKGISPEFLPHVFEHFRQQDSSTTRQFGGLGLGLAIVRQLVEAHGGTVAVASAGEGQGTTFSVYLPLRLTRQPAIDPALPAQTVRDLRGVRVLLVDDDADTQTLLAYLLEQQQLRVTQAGSALEALEALEHARFDVLISDIGMPDMDGYTLMRRIRLQSTERGGNLPAIAVTAYASEFDQQQALAAGFQTHLVKPLALEMLLQAIGQLVNPAAPCNAAPLDAESRNADQSG